MATVHPSRMGLVPGAVASLRNEDKYGGFDRARDRSWERERRRDRDRDSDYRPDSRRDRDDSRNRGRDRGRRYEKEDRGSRREGSPSPYEKKNGGRDEDRRERERHRRASPDYGSYRRAEPHLDNDNTNGDGNHGGDGSAKVAPWREPENMYASRGRGRPSAVGDDFFASRGAERASMEVNIWPPSPKEPSRDPADLKKKRSSKRRRSPSLSSDDDSEEERERRRRKEKKRKEKKEREERKHRHRQERSYDDDSEDDHKHRGRRSTSHRSGESDEEDERRRSRSHRRSRSRSEKRRERSWHKSRHSSRTETPPWSHGHRDADEEDEWVEKPADSFVARAEHTGKSPHMESVPKEEKQKHQFQHNMENASTSDSEEEVGPRLAVAPVTKGKKVDERQYGGALLRGEGSAMAAFLQDGNTQARIPRRGEIGLAPDEIAQFEAVGYVMSGSRHRRMNAVRMRKENQVISAEEKRGILKLQKEERERREAILRDEFRELVEEKLKGTAASGSGAK